MREQRELKIIGKGLLERRRNFDAACAAQGENCALSAPIKSALLCAELRFSAERCYLSKQPHLSATRRAAALNWLAMVASELQVDDETIYLAISYFDRFLEREMIGAGDQTLAAMAALLIACKFNDAATVPMISELTFFDDDACAVHDLRTMEARMLQALHFNLCCTTPHQLLNIYFNACSDAEALLLHGDGEDGPQGQQMHNTLLALSRFVLAVSMLDPSTACGAWLPSVLGASAILVARAVKGCVPTWTPALEARTKLSEHTLRACGRRMVELFLPPGLHAAPALAVPETTAYRKYKNSHLYSVALIAPEMWCAAASMLA